jgi:biotin carboxyl carrier protein
MVSAMKFSAFMDGQEHDVAIARVDEHRYEVSVDGTVHTVDARLCARDRVSVILDDRSYDISYAMDRERIDLQFWNQHFTIELLDERRLRMRRVRSQLDLSGPEIIKTSMPGKVVKLLVEPGAQVEAGAGVIIIEAMKMENEIYCRQGGLVKRVHVEAGQAVESDVVLVEIEPIQS